MLAHINTLTFNGLEVLNVDNYRGEINNYSKFSFDIALKSNNDLAQSIISSVLSDDCYNWLICEGVSDKIYLDEYLNKEIADTKTKLRIVPVIGWTQVVNMYNLLSISLDEYKANMKGKIFLLIDTDKNQMYQYNFKMEQNANLSICRLVNDVNDKRTKLKDYANQANTVTSIEDVLIGKAYYVVLRKMIKELLQIVKKKKMKIEYARKKI